jgi:hypothetical protein
VATIRDSILDYTQSIDDIEQRLEGSDYRLDELLTLEPEAKQTHPQAETSLVEIASQVRQDGVNSHSSPKKSLLSQQTPKRWDLVLRSLQHQKLKISIQALLDRSLILAWFNHGTSQTDFWLQRIPSKPPLLIVKLLPFLCNGFTECFS